MPSGPTGGDAGVKASAQALAEAKAASGGSGGGELAVADDPVMGTVVRGLTMLPVETEEAALDALFQGDLRRTTAEHSLNRHSNRSHCVFTLFVTQRSRLGTAEKAVVSRLNLVDLAGSERIKKTLGRAAAAGARSDDTLQRESMSINRSLSALEQCVVALTSKGRSHVPFRSSTLTNVLKDSLGGTSRTVLLACVWGERRHLEETVSTLNLAQRMTKVRTRAPAAGAGVLVDDGARAARLEREVRALRQELAMHDALAERGAVTYGEYGPEEREGLRERFAAFLDAATEPEEDDALPLVSVRQMREVLRLAKAAVKEARAEAADAAAGSQTAAAAAAAAAGAAGPGTAADVAAEGGPGTAGASGAAVGDLSAGLSGVSMGRTAAGARPPTGMRTEPRGVARPPPSESPRGEGGARAEEEEGKEGGGWRDGAGAGPGSPGARSFRGGAAEPGGGDEDGHRAAWEEFRGEGGEGERAARAAEEAAARAREARAGVSDAAGVVNGHKAAIDAASAELGMRRRARGGREDVDASGSVIVDADEFATLQALSSAKTAYREAAAVLRARADAARAAVRAAAEAKSALVRGFEAWFEGRTGTRLGDAVAASASPLRGAGGAAIAASPLARSAQPSPFRASAGFGPGSPVSPARSIGFGSSMMSAPAFGSPGHAGATGGGAGDTLDDGEAFEQLEAGRVAAQDPDALAYFKAGKRMAGTLRESKRMGVRLAHSRV